MKKILIGLVMGTAALAMASGAQASQIDDTTLAAGVVFGSGNINSHFAVDDGSNGIELGLQGLARYVGPYDPNGTSTYIVQGGTGPAAHPTQSFWDVAFSVDTGTELTLSNADAELCLHDAVTNTNGCFNVLGIPDNDPSGSSHLAQNAETLSFAGIAAALGDSGYNPWIADTYDFTLTLYNSSDTEHSNPLASVSATLETVPEPSTLALFGAALFGLGWLGFRRRNIGLSA